jgi:multidrug resistance efflux pump
LVSVSGLESAEAQAKSFRGQVAEHSTLVREIGASLEQFDPEEKQMDAQFASSIQAAITVEQRALDAIEAQLNPVVLLSPIDGFVSSIGHNLGESILAGDPILVVSSAKSERIVAYIRQPIRLEARPGMSVEVRSRSLSRAVGEGKIVGVGQQLEPILPELIPVKIGSGASAVEYGQPILVAIPPGLKIMPGEIVDLRPIPGTP